MGRKTYPIISIFVVLMGCSIACYAENVFEFGVHGGVAGWNAKTEYVAPQIGWHGGFQAYYGYYSPEIFGFRTGVTVDRHQASFGKTNYEDGYATIDVDGERMEIDYAIGRLRERYTTWSVGIPVQVSLTTHRFSVFVGPKVVFPLKSSWEQTVEHAALSVYYPAYDNRVEESYPLAASRDFEMQQKGEMTWSKVQWWLAAELSYAIPIETWSSHYKSYVMVGVYVDYSLSSHRPEKTDIESLIRLTDTRDGFPLQRLLTPVMHANRQDQALIRQCAPFAVGIKLSFGIAPYNPHKAAGKSCHCL